MTAPTYGVRLTIDATGSKVGASEHVRSIEQIKAANSTLPQSIAQGTSAIQQLGKGSAATALQTQFLQQELVKLGLTQAQATQAIKQMDASQVKLSETEQRAARASEEVRAAYELRVRAAHELAIAEDKARTATLDAGTGAAQGTVHFGRLERAASSLAFGLAGIPGPMGQVASSLGMLAIGGGWTVAVIAGVSAIVTVINSLHDAAERAEKPLKDLHDRALELGRARREAEGLTIASDLANANQAASELTPKIAAIETTLAAMRARGSDPSKNIIGVGLLEQLGKLQRQQRSYAEDAEEFAREKAEREQRAAEDQERKDKAEKERLKALQKAAEDARLKPIQEQLRLLEALGGAELEKSADFQALRAQNDKDDEKRKAASKARIEGINAETDATIEAAKQSTDLWGAAERSRADALAKEEDQARRLKRLLIDELGQGLRNVFQGAGQDVQRLIGQLEQAASGIASMISRAKELGQTFEFGKGFSGKGSTGLNIGAGLSAGGTIGTLASDPFIGAFGGAAAGFAVGGPFGAVAGAISGFVSGLFDSGAKARDAAEKMKEAREAFDLNLKDFVAIASPRGALGDALANLDKESKQLRDQLAAAYGLTKTRAANLASGTAFGGAANPDAQAYLAELRELDAQYQRNAEAIRKQIELEQQRLGEDTQVRILRAKGQTDEAEAQALRNQHQREFADLVKSFGSGPLTDAQQALLDLISTAGVLEEAALAARQAAAAVDKAFQGQISEFGLQAREARARGDNPAALQADYQAQVTEANRQYAAGLLDTDHWLRTVAVITREYNNTLEATAKALIDYNATLTADLELRALQARAVISGSQADAQAFEDAQRHKQQELELNQAIAQGADLATQALFDQVHTMEDLAVAAQRARQVEQERNRVLEESARLVEDLRVRELAALGQEAASSEAAQLYRQQEELRKAQEAGRTPEQLAEIQRVQALERARADADRRAQQQAAFDQAFPTTGTSAIAASATSINLAVGVSETTGGRIAGLLMAQLTYQASLPLILASQIRIEALLRAQGGSGSDLDELLQSNADDGERAAGNPPANR